jgi:chemotaxis signal transduction protein/DNA-binding XRE family transcriptional regulator
VDDDAALLRRARLRAGLTQRQLAERAGTSQAMVARLEGGRQSPSLPTLRRLLEACGTDIHLQVEGEIPSSAQGAVPAAAARHLVLGMGEARIAVRLHAVREVLPAPPLHQLPAQPPHMAGVALVRGQPLACADLAGMIGLASAEARTLVVLETAAGPLGALVGHADRVLELDAEAVSRMPAGWTACAAVGGLAAVDGELLPILDPSALRLG